MRITQLLAAGALVAALPQLAGAHSPGALDAYGCHDDKRHGTYHCHRGDYQGIEFRGKADMVKAVQAGTAPSQAKQEADAKVPERESLLGPLIGEKTTDQRAASTSEVIVPQGIEHRLEVLQNLRDKGLITPSEYEQKKKEILGTL